MSWFGFEFEQLVGYTKTCGGQQKGRPESCPSQTGLALIRRSRRDGKRDWPRREIRTSDLQSSARDDRRLLPLRTMTSNSKLKQNNIFHEVLKTQYYVSL